MATISEAEKRLVSLRANYTRVQEELQKASLRMQQLGRVIPAQPITIDMTSRKIGQLEETKTRLHTDINALKKRISEMREAATRQQQENTERRRESARAVIEDSEKEEESVPATTPAAAASAPTAAASAPTVAASAPTAAESNNENGSNSNEEPVIKNNRFNDGINQYKKEHHDYILKQIEDIEKQIDELKTKESTPEEDNESNNTSTGIQWRGGKPSTVINSVDIHIEKLEARIVELEKRVQQLEENCCNEFTESLIDQNKRKIGNLKKQIELLKSGMYLDIFGEIYLTGKIDDEGKEQPYDGILTLNAFFRNYGLNRRYVNKDAEKDKWSREYVDDVLKVFNKYFAKDNNPHKIFKSQLLDDKEKDSVLLCPHLKRRYQTIQWDIERETIQGTPMNPSRLEGVGHYYRRVLEDLDEFLRKTQICKGKISLPEKPLKKSQLNLEDDEEDEDEDEDETSTIRRRQPTGAKYRLPDTERKKQKGFRTGDEEEESKGFFASIFQRSPSSSTGQKALGQKALGQKVSKQKPSKQKPSKQKPIPPAKIPLQPTVTNIHLISYLTNKLSTKDIEIEQIPIIEIFKSSLTAFSLQQLGKVEPQTNIYPTQLAAYLTNTVGKTYDVFSFEKIKDGLTLLEEVKPQTNIYPTQLAAYLTNTVGIDAVKTYDITNVHKLHLAAYLTNKLSTKYVEIEQIPIIEIFKSSLTPFSLQQLGKVEEQPDIYTTQLAAYLTNTVGKTYDVFSFEKIKDGLTLLGEVEAQPDIYPTQLAAYLTNTVGIDAVKTYDITNVHKLHLAAYLTNKLSTEDIEFDEIPIIEIEGIPIIYDITHVRTLHLIAYMMNKMAGDIELSEIPLINIPSFMTDNSPPTEPDGEGVPEIPGDTHITVPGPQGKPVNLIPGTLKEGNNVQPKYPEIGPVENALRKLRKEIGVVRMPGIPEGDGSNGNENGSNGNESNGNESNGNESNGNESINEELASLPNLQIALTKQPPLTAHVPKPNPAVPPSPLLKRQLPSYSTRSSNPIPPRNLIQSRNPFNATEIYKTIAEYIPEEIKQSIETQINTALFDEFKAKIAGVTDYNFIQQKAPKLLKLTTEDRKLYLETADKSEAITKIINKHIENTQIFLATLKTKKTIKNRKNYINTFKGGKRTLTRRRVRNQRK